MTLNRMYPAQGHTVVESTFNQQLFLTAGNGMTQENHVVAAGQVLEAGSVMGMITATQELTLCDSASADGSEEPYAIILEPLDTTAASEEISVMVMTAETVNLNALTYGPSWTQKSIQIALSRRGISTKTPFYSGL